ncbi:MAG: hypothetical protein KJ622_02570 [Alphaproteobacteria bacterium]|nr:hypothetical protein [Alphaproteobacteria bacterium]
MTGLVCMLAVPVGVVRSEDKPGAGANSAAAAADGADWPCAQRKVDKLTSAQIWDGPPVDDIRDWWKDKEAAKLVRFLISRRIQMDEAETAIAKFAESIPEGEQRDKRLTLLFAGILQETNSSRSGIITGIERFQDRQRARARKLQEESTAIAELRKRQAAGENVDDEFTKAQEEYDWNARVFKEREDNLPLACEIPVEIEQRAFALGRAIRFHMS